MRVWTPCEVWRHARLALSQPARWGPLASYSHVRALPRVLRLRGFPQPCFPSLCSRQLYFLRLCSQSPCSQPRDSPRPCCPSPCFRRLCSQSLSSRLPYLLRLYSRSLCSQLFDSPQLCSRWPCSPSLLSQWPCSLRPYFRWPLSRSRGPPPALREQRFLALAWDGR